MGQSPAKGKVKHACRWAGHLPLLLKEYGKQIVWVHGGNELSFWAGDFLLAALGAWGGSQERKRQLPQSVQIFRPVVFRYPRGILPKYNVQAPMQFVFY
jgi:hypothetical protein